MLDIVARDGVPSENDDVSPNLGNLLADDVFTKHSQTICWEIEVRFERINTTDNQAKPKYDAVMGGYDATVAEKSTLIILNPSAVCKVCAVPQVRVRMR